jgi:hypothetical protein
MKDQDDSRSYFLAFAIIGTATTIWALAVCGIAILWGGAL